MKKTVTALLAMLLCAASYGQARKPSIMVVPSDLWCDQMGYMTLEDRLGEKVPVPDYATALRECTVLLPVISKINALMADRGFPLKNLESEIKSLRLQAAETAVVTSGSGAAVRTNALDQLRQRARADLILQLTWTLNDMAGGRTVTYTLQGLDSYTDLEVATVTGTGAPSYGEELPVLLAKTVERHMDEFCDRLQAYFDDLMENGRKISLDIRVFENEDGMNLESEYDGDELREIIEDWVYDHAKYHRYNLADDSEVNMNFDEVSIPLYDEKGRALSASNFARKLEKYLKAEPFHIPIRHDNAGLGRAVLYLFK